MTQPRKFTARSLLIPALALLAACGATWIAARQKGVAGKAVEAAQAPPKMPKRPLLVPTKPVVREVLVVKKEVDPAEVGKVLLERAEPLSRADVDLLIGAKLTPEEAEKLLERTRSEVKGMESRALVCAMILAALCNGGHDAQAWAMVTEEAGQERATELGIVFGRSKEPMDKLVARFRQVEDTDERVHALNGLIGGHREGVTELDFAQLGLKSGLEKNILATVLGSVLSQIPGPEGTATAQKILEQSIGLLKDKTLTVAQLGRILDGNRASDPLESWQMVNTLKGDLDPKDLESLQSKMVNMLIDADVKQGMAAICAEPTTKYSVPILNMAIDKMYGSDPVQANAWVTQSLPTIDPATGQRVIARIAEVSAKHGEYDTARKWAGQLLNPDVRQRTLDEIHEAERPKVN